MPTISTQIISALMKRDKTKLFDWKCIIWLSKEIIIQNIEQINKLFLIEISKYCVQYSEYLDSIFSTQMMTMDLLYLWF